MDRTRAMNRRLLTLVALLLSLSALVWLLLSYRVTLEVDLSGIENPFSTEVKAGDVSLDPGGREGKIFTQRLRPGKYNLFIANPGYNIINEQISVGIFGKKIIPSFTKVDEKNAARHTYLGMEGIKYSNEKLFINNTWVVFQVEPENDDADGLIVVAKQKSSGAWRVVLEGSSIDYDAALEPIPQEAKSYLESL